MTNLIVYLVRSGYTVVYDFCPMLKKGRQLIGSLYNPETMLWIREDGSWAGNVLLVSRIFSDVQLNNTTLYYHRPGEPVGMLEPGQLGHDIMVPKYKMMQGWMQDAIEHYLVEPAAQMASD